MQIKKSISIKKKVKPTPFSMSVNGRTAYVDFTTTIAGIETAIRIFETETHCFVYVNQFPTEMHLYNDLLKNALQKNCQNMGGKEFSVICNLSNHESLADVSQHIAKILNE